MSNLMPILGWFLVIMGAISLVTLLFGLFFSASLLVYYRISSTLEVRKLRCPRCDQVMPDWQPVHLSCFFIRSWYWFLGMFIILSTLMLLIPIGIAVLSF